MSISYFLLSIWRVSPLNNYIDKMSLQEDINILKVVIPQWERDLFYLLIMYEQFVINLVFISSISYVSFN